MSATWRLLEEREPSDGARSMALDRAIQIAHARGLVPPTLRLYSWMRPTVTLGRFQPASDVDIDACVRSGVGVVRRFTGGRGVLHDDEVTYSLVAGLVDGLPRGVAASYRTLSGMLVEAYGALGVPAQLTARPRGSAGSAACYLHATQADLSLDESKLSGSAQVWFEGTVLQHGSVVRSRDAALEGRLFRLDAQGIAELEASTATLAGLLGTAPDGEKIRAALVGGLERALGITVEPGELTPPELELESELRDALRVVREETGDSHQGDT